MWSWTRTKLSLEKRKKIDSTSFDLRILMYVSHNLWRLTMVEILQKSSEKFPLSERCELGSLGFVRFVYNLQNNKKTWFKIRDDTAWVVSPTPNWLRPVQSFPSARRGALYDLEWLQLAHNQLTQLASLTAAGGEREKVIYATLCDPLINPSRVFQRRRGRY